MCAFSCDLHINIQNPLWSYKSTNIGNLEVWNYENCLKSLEILPIFMFSVLIPILQVLKLTWKLRVCMRYSFEILDIKDWTKTDFTYFYICKALGEFQSYTYFSLICKITV